MTTQHSLPTHTALPWSYCRSQQDVGWLIQGKNTTVEPLDQVYDPASGKREPVYQHLIIGEMDDLPEAQANAEFIIRACNAHNSLRSASQTLYDEVLHYLMGVPDRELPKGLVAAFDAMESAWSRADTQYPESSDDNLA